MRGAPRTRWLARARRDATQAQKRAPFPPPAGPRPLPAVDIKLRVEKPDGAVLYEHLIFSNLDEAGGMLDTIVKKARFPPHSKRFLGLMRRAPACSALRMSMSTMHAISCRRCNLASPRPASPRPAAPQGAKLTAPVSGAYAFCLDNRMAKWTAKVLTFELALRDPSRAPVSAGALAAGASASETAAHSVAVLKGMAARLRARLLAIENAQQYHYHREVQHRAVLERTRSRVGLYGAVEGVVVAVLTALQVILLRTWVTRKQAATGGAGLPRASASV